MNNTELVNQIAAAVTKVLENNAEFSNVARPKATKASTATQGAWNINEEPKASSATQGAWDSTNTPGGVSANAKKVWTAKDIEASVRKAIADLEFHNEPHPYPTKTSASVTQQVNDPIPSGKTSASNTQQINDPIPSGKTSASNTQQVNDPIPSGKVSASTIAQILANVYKLQ